MKNRTLYATVLLATSVCFLGGCGGGGTTAKQDEQHEATSELVATKDIPAGSIIENSRSLFRIGKLYYKGEKPKSGPLVLDVQPADIFPGEWIGIIEGKKVVRDLKEGEVVKITDIVQPDGSPFRHPPK